MRSVLCFLFLFFFFKQKTAYELRISDWSSDVCSSDLAHVGARPAQRQQQADLHRRWRQRREGLGELIQRLGESFVGFLRRGRQRLAGGWLRLRLLRGYAGRSAGGQSQGQPRHQQRPPDLNERSPSSSRPNFGREAPERPCCKRKQGLTPRLR